MSPLRLTGSTSGYSQLDAPAIAGDQTFTLPSTGGTLDRLNRAGNVLQVVNATYGTSVSNSTATFADTGLTASITPTSASSKILVIANQVSIQKGTTNSAVEVQLLRDSTVLFLFEAIAGYNATTTTIGVGGSSISYLDSPATTSSITYKTQFRSANASSPGSVNVQSTGFSGAPYSTITLMEVAA